MRNKRKLFESQTPTLSTFCVNDIVDEYVVCKESCCARRSEPRSICVNKRSLAEFEERKERTLFLNEK